MTKLEKMILDKGVKIYHISRDTFVWRSTIYDIIQGKTTILNIPAKTALEICNYLECNIMDLVDDDDEYRRVAEEYTNRNS